MGFASQFDKARRNALRAAQEEAQRRVSGFMGAVVDDTPVLHGALKGSWQAGQTSTQFSDNTPLDPTGVYAKQMIITAVRALPMDTDWEIWFGNVKPYARRIEYEGHSAKAPTGMLRKNIVKGGESLVGFKGGMK